MPDELQRAIATEFNPVRVNFHEGPEIWVEDVLNMGISPRWGYHKIEDNGVHFWIEHRQ